MKKLLLMASAIVLAAGMTGCKTQRTLAEATTVAAPASQYTEVTPVQYTAPAPVEEAPIVMAGDRQEHVTVVDNGDSGLLKNYNVIVGSFGNKVNAENQKQKMMGRGYNSFLVQNESGMYRVVAAGFDTREAATQTRDAIRSNYSTEAGTCAEAWLLIPQR